MLIRRFIVLATLALAACDDSADESVAGTADQGVPEGVVLLSEQSTTSAPTGRPFYLPQPADAADAWQLDPGTAGARLIAGADGFDRVLPLKAGTFSARLGDFELEVTTRDRAADPYHNLNYYPSRGVAQVGDEAWVAQVFSPRITRFDAASGVVVGTIDVGGWPVAIAWADGQAEALVALREDDTLGVIDRTSGQLVDAIWVGDEPANVVVSADGATAYVASATESVVLEVDVAERRVLRRLPAPPDALGLALDEAGQRLFVAGHRTGQPSRAPYPDTPVADEKDLFAIDLTTGEATPILDVAAMINALEMHDGVLYVAGSRRDPTANLGNADEVSFEHMIIALDPSTGDELAAVDLGRQASSGGWAVALHGMAAQGDKLFVVAEGSDLTLELQLPGLEEVARHPTVGRPRSVAIIGERVLVHGLQGFSATWITDEGAGQAVSLGDDPRPVAVAAGQRYFTGAGEGYAQNWSCNSCHGDALTDTMVWNAGPFDDRVVSRPFVWLEGAFPLGWAGYLSSVRNYAYTVNTNVGVRPDTALAENLAAYLASVMPPPAANGWTQRDGAHSEQGLRGKAIYEGEGRCADCHALPLTTSQAFYEDGITPGPTDVPILVGAYRHNVWLKHGESATLRDGVVAALDWLEIGSLSDSDVDDLTRYVQELTDRHFFVLTSTPVSRDQAVDAGAPLKLTLNAAPESEAAVAAALTLSDGAGAPVDLDVAVTGRHVVITPESSLAFETDYTLTLAPTLKALDGRALFDETTVRFKTAAAPSLRVEGDYVWKVEMPVPDFIDGGFDSDTTATVTVPLTVSAEGGALARYDLGDGLTFDSGLVVSGDQLMAPPVPVPVGPSFADTSGLVGQLEDDDGDGIADRVEGELVASGPGFLLEGVKWRLERPAPANVCPVGTESDVALSVTMDDQQRPVFEWAADAGDAIAMYVTEPGATIPFAPGQTVTGGETYWALNTSAFPQGFVAPVTYGVVPEGASDTTVENGGTLGGSALETGGCYSFTVITTGFQVLTLVVELGE